VDANRFDSLARNIGEQRNRRDMLKSVAAGTLAVAGLGAVARTALGQDVSAEAQGFEGDECDNSDDCKKGLVCKTRSSGNKRCEYKKNCGGKKNDACKNNGDCCKNKNLKCQNRKCKRQKN
jgi:hypothetical protein